MVIDKIENLGKYVSLHPLFPQAFEYLQSTDLLAQEIGKVNLLGDELVVNIAETGIKAKEDARLETHNRFIDIQIPLSGVEIMGYTPRAELPEETYNEEKDITFYDGLAENYLAVKPGMFVIFFPEDGHAPAITPEGVKKVIVKVLV